MPIPYFDAHCDTGTKALRSGEGLRANGVHLDLTRLAAYAPAAQVFAVFSRPAGHDWRAGYEQDSPAEALGEHGTACLDALVRELENNADLAVICRSADEARAAAAQGKIAAFLAVEGARRCTVWTAETNAAALRLYESAGFAPDGWQSEVLLWE